MALTGVQKIMSVKSITHSLSPSISHSLPGVVNPIPGSSFPCPCTTQDLACQACLDEALDSFLDEAKETDHQEWGAW